MVLLDCLLWLIISVIIAVIVLFIVEAVLHLLVAPMPPQVVGLLRVLAALLVLIWFLGCMGLLPVHGRVFTH